MAKIVLSIISDTAKQTEGIKNLSSAVSALGKQLSSIKVNNDLTKQLQELTKYYQQFTAEIEAKTKLQEKEQQTQAKSVSSVETLRKGVANLITTLKTLEQQYPDKTFKESDEAAKTYKQTLQGLLNELDGYSQTIRDNGKLEDTEKSRIAEISKQYKQLAADVAKAKAVTDKIQLGTNFDPKALDQLVAFRKQLATTIQSTKSLQKYYKKGTFDGFISDLNNTQQKLTALNATVDQEKGLTSEQATALKQLRAEFQQTSAAIKEAEATNKNYHGSLQEIVAGFLKFQLAAMLIMKPLQLIRNAISSINETLIETEDTVIEIKRVLNDSGVTNGEISSELYKIAINLGQTFENVSEIATNFAKTGMSWQDTLKATEAAVLALNVAELTAEQSSEGLIAIMQQFGYTASDLTYIIDVLNKTADNNAVTTDELLTGLQKTGSYAKAANLSLEDTVALITRLSEATAASGQQLGNAMKSLLAYSSKDSSLTTFASLSDDMAKVVAEYKRGAVSMLEVWEALGKQMNNLSEEQANLLMQWSDSSGLETELGAELYDIQDQLTGVYDTAGTYRKNYFIALLSNLDGVQDQIDEIGDSAGYTMKEQETYMQSYTAKVNALNSEWEYLITQQEEWLSFKKRLVETGTLLLKLIEWTGGLRTTVIALGTVLWFAFGDKIISSVKKFKDSLSSLIAGLKATASAGEKAQAALGWIGIIATALSVAFGIISSASEKAKADYEEWLNTTRESAQTALNSLSTLEEKINGVANAYDEYGEKIKALRAIKDDEASSTENVASAEQQLLDIQNDLAEKYNQNYADSIDLVNGKLQDQLKILQDLDRQQSESEVRQQVKDYIESNSDALYNAKKYNSEKLTEIVFGESTGYWSGAFSDKELLSWLKKLNLHANDYTVSDASGVGGFLESLITDSDVYHTRLYTEGMTRTEQIAYLEDLFNKAVHASNGDATAYLPAQIREAINAINDETYKSVQKLLYGDESATGLASLPIEILEAFNNRTLSYDEFIAELKKAQGIQEDLNKGLDATQKKLENIREGWDDIVDKLKEYKDLQKQALDLEEKQLAVEEAKKALEDAKNGRGIMRYSEASGQFEWVQDEKAIASAEDNLQKAVDALNEYVAEQAWDEMLEEMKDGTATNEKILELLANWISKGADSNPDWAKQYLEWIKETTGVDLSKQQSDTADKSDNTDTTIPQNTEKTYSIPKGIGRTTQEEKEGILNALKNGDYETFKRYMPSAWDEERKKQAYTSSGGVFDNGGIASGLGFMPKATAQPESVNNPELTKMILNPTSNSQFDRYIHDMGLMFETAQRYSQAPQMISTVGNTTTNTDNHSVTINGINLTQEQSNQLLSTLQMIGLVQNNK